MFCELVRWLLLRLSYCLAEFLRLKLCARLRRSLELQMSILRISHLLTRARDPL